MEIYRTGNGGDPQIDPGSLKRANSLNVYSSTIVATASAGTTLDANIYKNYEFFNVAQTSAGTDKIVLPASYPVGTKLTFFAASALVVGSQASSGIGINGGTDVQSVAIAANSTLELMKVSATRWIATHFSTAGAVTAPTPA